MSTSRKHAVLPYLVVVALFSLASLAAAFIFVLNDTPEKAKKREARSQQTQADVAAYRQQSGRREAEEKVRSRFERTARRYVEHEAGDARVEISSFGEPYTNGSVWAVQVYYVKDDHRGRRAKITEVYFSPLNFEVVGSRDVL